ncbi:hypothetical protein [Chryseobacterium sp. AG363]|uniref:hypothetical protein n=1 Tax=Chryseobacterium sp. AG363 TaxID=2183997 RepID=UPI000E74281F|nr:hypothetical protein [Chryseobacterium sp. AG363]RKE82020.1 hypothetical protein DEU39_1570 [Chryseobacterium sp. AG363]
MKIPKLNLKNLFLKGQKPNQEAFWNWIDSYWHKDEEIDQAAVKGLESTLANKLDKGVETTLLNAFNDAVSNVNSILKGEATPTSSPTAWLPGSPDLYEKWEATTVGTYTNFKGSNGLPIEVTLTDIDKKFVFLNMTNGVAKKTTVPIPGVNVSPVFDPLDSEKAQGGKQIADYINFSSKPFNYVLDFSKDNFGKYTELIGTITFSEGSGSLFGKVAYVKLTGGNVTFPSDFVPQLGTADYDPTKTNTIAFWKEYDKIRFFNEISALEPLPTNDIITSYNFQNRSPNAALSTIPHIGAVLTGNISDHSISTDGQFLRRLTTATSGAAAIAVDTGGVINYKATFIMSIYSMLDVLIGGNTYDNYVNYINIRAQSPASDVVWVSASNPTGTTIATTPNIPYPQFDWYLWEFVVNGSQVKFFCNGNFIVEYTNPNTGNYFSFILNKKEDGVKSFKIEKL